MRESERLAAEGLRMLAGKGWPESAAHELMDLFMRAGMHYWQERQSDEAARNEALIQKAANSARPASTEYVELEILEESHGGWEVN